ncbi:FTO catalytic domain-containing protein [Ochromonadaceae sp. CCMP2298]|nr:FTO catalytic domain-containing protein [Ochromonadaceae sp. CCMP2298]
MGKEKASSFKGAPGHQGKAKFVPRGAKGAAKATQEGRGATEVGAAGAGAKLSKQDRRNRNRALRADTATGGAGAGKDTRTRTQPTAPAAPAQAGGSVYKRETHYPPTNEDCAGPWDRFLRPGEEGYQSALDRSYDGVVVDPPEKFPDSFHKRFETALRGLDMMGFYQFDMTQPGGLNTHVAKTFVTRCLLGDAGITYKYLGIRMFSIPWDWDSPAAAKAAHAAASAASIVSIAAAAATATDAATDADPDADADAGDAESAEAAEAQAFTVPTPTSITTSTPAPLTSSYAVAIGRLNRQLVTRTEELLAASGRETTGSCQYNLTLVNRCFPQALSNFKTEPTFGAEKCAVSWHADSTLEHFSSIGVYHCTSADAAASTSAAACPEVKKKNRQERRDKRGARREDKRAAWEEANADAVGEEAEDGEGEGGHVAKRAKTEVEEKGAEGGEAEGGSDASWELALKVWYDAEGPGAGKLTQPKGEGADAGVEGRGDRVAPSLSLPLPNRSAYFLLDDFNHHHQHSILAGTTHRYASTHRVCRTEGHTFWHIRQRCQRLLAVTGRVQVGAKHIRQEQLAMAEIEFEWVRQYYVQGEKHRQLHQWWVGPMAELERMWGEMGERLAGSVQLLYAAATMETDCDPSNGNSSTGNSSSKKDSKKDGKKDGKENVGDADGEGADAAGRKARKQWLKLKQRTEQVDAQSYQELADLLRERHEKRLGWIAREAEPAFLCVPEDCRPLPCPLSLDAELRLASFLPVGALLEGGGGRDAALDPYSPPEALNLLDLARRLEQWKSQFLVRAKSAPAPHFQQK